jgi:hypothetical protein
MLAAADAAAAKDNLALAVDLLTRAAAGGADARALKRTELRLDKGVQRKLVLAKKKKDRDGLAEAQALAARLRSLKVARKR